MTQVAHVVCCQQRLTHYRESFFEKVRVHLAAKDIRFDLVHGQPDDSAVSKKDGGHLEWAHQVESQNFRLGNRSLVWLPTPPSLALPDLVIVTQENKLLANYFWLLRRLFQPVKVAYWGHGRNFQSERPSGWLEHWKQLMICRVDWWFAYTELTREIVRNAGFPDARITVLDNAIDNESFRADLASVSGDDLQRLRTELALPKEAPTALFCGSLYPDKRLGFMIEAADRIRQSVPGFSLIVIGDGPGSDEIRAAAATRPWLHWVGVRKGREKAAYFRLASVAFNPGLVGLHILDSFCAGIPMVTTLDARHSPEISYLEHGVNGISTAGNVSDYSDAVIELLRNSEYRERIRLEALKSADRYTLDNMVERFCEGIEQCLQMPKKL